jgi:murein DD-endopeptidase MepM/ murein hydrolase activator NlpD
MASATWPFSRADAAEGDAVFVHDSSMRLLASAAGAATTTDSGAAAVLLSDGTALVPGTPLSGASAESGNSRGSISRYTVREGDTLSSIAKRYGISVNTLLWANDLTAASIVRPGKELVILPVSGIRHTVKSGDTLSTLAKKYGADQDDIASFNGIASATGLSIGDEVIIPGGEIAVPAKAKVLPKSTATARGTAGAAQPSGFFDHPVPGATLSQGVHGWNGVDLAAPNGTPIYASAGGTVIVSKVGGYNGGYGNYIVVDHGGGIQTLYSHLSTDLVTVGQEVAQGERIGTVGITGAATGYHLHFEVRGAKNPFRGCSLSSRCSI